MNYLKFAGVVLLCNFTVGWVPPGMSEHLDQTNSPGAEETTVTPLPTESQLQPTDTNSDHTHKDNANVAEVIMDAKHIIEDMGEIFSEQQVDHMDLDEKLFLWFQTHDWDKNDQMDGLELFKALSHDHNYHHDEEESSDDIDAINDPMQHTAPAQRQRFRRTEKIVDKLLDLDDIDKDGQISFPEFVSAFRGGNMDGLKVKKA